jgi:hypothetical protein
VAAGRKALVVATYQYADGGLRQLTAPGHDAEDFAAVLEDPAIADFDVTMLVNQPHYVVGEAIADFYGDCRRDDLTLLYFSGHGLKDDEGRLHLAMTNTRREALLFTAISAAQLNEAMDACASRRKVLVLDCCYSGAFPAGRTAKSDEGVQTLERFQGKGRAVLTASDATQYAFEGDDLSGSGTSSVFTRYLVEAMRSGEADLDEDGDIALDELYSYVREKVVAEVPQQRPKKQEDVDGRILIARNVHWTLPDHLRHAIESPISAQRLSAVDGLAHLHRVGNDVVRAAVVGYVAALAADDSRSVTAAATALLARINADEGRLPVKEEPAAAAPAPRSPVQADAAAERPEPVLQPSVGGPEPARRRKSPGAGPPLPLVQSLVLTGGILLLLSRFLVFESSYGYRAADFGISTVSWLVGVGLPLLVAFQLLLLRGTAPRAVAVAGGLITGAALSQLDLTLGTTAFWFHPDVTQSPGPGWWCSLLGTVVLIGCALVVITRPVFRARPGLRSDWRATLAVLVIVGALVAWLNAFGGHWLWFTVNEPALLLAIASLPVAALALDGAQRLLGLAAVTVLGSWVASVQVRALITQVFTVDAGAAVVALAAVVCTVGACWLAGAPPPARS